MEKRGMEQAMVQLARANENLAQAKLSIKLAYAAFYGSLVFLGFILGRLTS